MGAKRCAGNNRRGGHRGEVRAKTVKENAKDVPALPYAFRQTEKFAFALLMLYYDCVRHKIMGTISAQ